MQLNILFCEIVAHVNILEPTFYGQVQASTLSSFVINNFWEKKKYIAIDEIIQKLKFWISETILMFVDLYYHIKADSWGFFYDYVTQQKIHMNHLLIYDTMDDILIYNVSKNKNIR